MHFNNAFLNLIWMHFLVLTLSKVLPPPGYVVPYYYKCSVVSVDILDVLPADRMQCIKFIQGEGDRRSFRSGESGKNVLCWPNRRRRRSPPPLQWRARHPPPALPRARSACVWSGLPTEAASDATVNLSGFFECRWAEDEKEILSKWKRNSW